MQTMQLSFSIHLQFKMYFRLTENTEFNRLTGYIVRPITTAGAVLNTNLTICVQTSIDNHGA